MKQLPPYLIEMKPFGNEWPRGVVVSIESPIANRVCESFSIEFKGFVARVSGATLTRPRRLTFLAGARQLRSCPIKLPRPDIIAPGSGISIDVADVDCGFDTVLPSFLSRRDEPIEIRVQHDPDPTGISLEYRLASIAFRPYRRRRKRTQLKEIGLVSVNSIGRSGSSLVCHGLDLHPACVAPKLEGQYGEIFILGHYLRAIGVLSSEGAIAELNKFDLGDFLSLSVGYLRTDFGESGHEAKLYTGIMSETRRQSIELFSSVLRKVAKYARATKPAAKYWVEKTWNWSSTNIAPSLIKNFREIIVLRHIRDFWRSQRLYQQKLRSSQEQLRLHADGTYHKYILLAEACRDRRPGVLVLRYEDLIADPRAGFGQVFQHLDLSYDEQLAEQVEKITRGDGAHRTLLTSSQSENTEPDDFDNYLALLTEGERRYLGSLLVELGYSL